ncbi:SDR family oxidoreductase [Streptococcus pluranimalium]|uniref:NAD(P)-dependent oxidoreductase n=1 Tax=Streptococcus pluranimalium TaxID=82348 RepID=A0A2L0D5T3_9STRE|nr:SDR family oxidoreductase [Streptococcus pluranimalium]AUW97182.1 NAD(P)-dependent oxidoreductase [Streptococcus pluranimalium]
MLAITGVTGKLGGQLARELSQAGISARLLARRPQAVEDLEHMTVHESYYDTSQTTIDSLTGADVLFMVSGRESANRLQEHKNLIDAAKIAGVKHIVYTSFYQAAADATFTLARDHAATEAYIQEQGFTYTFIRDNFYMDFFVDLCREYGEIKGPAGSGKVSAVVRDDVVAVALTILKNPQNFDNQVLDMTGPECLSMAEIADIVGRAWKKNITYIEETVEEAYESRKAWPAEDWEYDSWVSTYTAIAKGELQVVSNDIENILGRPATSLREFLRDLA